MSKKFQTYTRPWIKRETVIDKKKRAARVVHTLEKSYPNAHMALQYRTRIQLLVAVMLSAQCTDKKVNEVTVPLFKKYKTVKDFANAKQAVFEKEIYQTGFYRAKAKNIIAACKKIEADFSGRLPRAMAQILTLPGVARKTANVVLGNAYGVVDGIAVDTHVSRIAQRLGLTKNTSPEKIEQELMKLFPKKEWFAFTYRVINHGRAICEAKKPKCGTCLLRKLCPSALA
ncbi:MAG: endonuclease III [Candidatus Ryanbacteria bacterium RIFCSPHIGHO2_02_FULL_45_13b]|uniref:Endonuclease III n=1 Tax=Candidatus Ryanbacteria bacterium RIFCSPHIGHO2_02_FULL_45_13b TaxID=1802117 RepID=A0A1G2G6R7_9BACT|nr:MAG: endonuclease III [Candidatus Ryanbacteria bacterium RIFCSPHIGHO2_02_FULL_45_13b]